MQPPAALSNRPTAPSHGLVAPATGLTPPSRRVAAARNRYRTDGTTGMTGGRLLVALYQRLLSDLVGAETAIEAGQIESAHLQLVHAQEIVDSLEDALDPSAWDQADRMVSLYAHLRRELIAANVTTAASTSITPNAGPDSTSAPRARMHSEVHARPGYELRIDGPRHAAPPA